ncbi:MAG: dihydroorotate dehydrogenase electron transfer subunit [Lachnospiraceae bacterium]|nr:dihydroorotate dehydrogenase electron transfer subunit [Lachnospiraceae bacterium]
MTEKHFEKANVVSQESLQPGIYSLRLETSAAKTAVPGQFVNLYLGDKSHLLPRPISICEIDKEAGTLRLVYRMKGEGTKAVAELTAGDALDIMAPLGNGFPLDIPMKRPMVIGGGIGVPPMLGLFEKLTGDKMAVMGYLDEPFLLNEFNAAGGSTFVATESGRTGMKGNVIDAVKANDLTPDVIYACGPKPMLAAVKALAEEKNIPCYISMEERMACGIGACLGCVVKTTSVDDHSKVKNARVCADGPVFRAGDVDLS